jgi:hypothetical protein
MRKYVFATILAALFIGAALFPAPAAWAGSCCGGGVATGLILPTYADSMIDISTDLETYDGFWDQNGKYTHDPPGSNLKQYRLNAGYAKRFASRWQAGLLIPYVWNDNVYSGLSSHTSGLGDSALHVWYEAMDDTSAWKVRSFSDLKPSLLIGSSLLIPTGVSPYDDVTSSFDVTGRGFYRLDGNVYIDKTIHPWDVSLSLSYGTYLQRSVNREYGKYVEPYHKKLGNRGAALLSIGYIYYIGTSGDTLTGSVSASYLNEADATINGLRVPDSGFRKEALGLALLYSSTDRDWSLRASWSHAIKQDGWGYNFPITDIYSLGVRYVFR